MAEIVISSAISLLEFFLDEQALPSQGWEHKCLVEEKAATVKGAEEQLQGLKSDLTSMLHFLEESSGSRNRHHSISQVREMAQHVGVIIDTFIFTKSEELESTRLNTFLREIKSIRSRFQEVDIQTPVEEADYVEQQRDRAPCEGGDVDEDEDKDLVDIASGLEPLIRIVSSARESRFVMMIIGMGGIGKTTLARQLYKHVDMVERFDCRGWACVSSEFKPEEVLRALIRQVGDLCEEEEEEVMGKMDVESLQRKLHQCLQGKRYLIVLDNLWDDTSVSHVLHALPEEDTRSTVVLTGRAANSFKFSKTFYILRDLNSDTSWQLFLKMVFGSDYKCPKHLEEIGRKIVKMCHGLPLAIKEAGRQLATKTQSESESAWEEFLESMDFSQTMSTLELSYHKLSPARKSYFLHMCFFKEGATIRVQQSVHIWIAAGMIIRSDKSQDMEDTATRYFHELHLESLITMIDFTIDAKRKTFCINGFLRKICITKAQEEIGFEILGNGKNCPPLCKPSHRAIYCSRDIKLDYSTNHDKCIISLFFHGGGNFDVKPTYWEGFEQLRILDFEGFGLKSLSETVCALARLRYLGLRDNYLQKLPHTLCRLKNLEVLDIAQNFMIEVPDIVWKMDSLRHLYMSDIICRTPLTIDSLKCLQTLTYISAYKWTYELSNLEKMTSLRKLGIEELDENLDVSKLFASLAKLENLGCLILKGFRFRTMPSLDGLSSLHRLTRLKLNGRLAELPVFPKGLNCLTLTNSCLHEDPIPELEKLPQLYALKLRNAYTGREIVFSQHDSKLEILCIEELWNLRNIRAEKTLKWRLVKMEIFHCPYLDSIPKEIVTSDSWSLANLKLATARKIAKLILQSGVTSNIHGVDILPYRRLA